jgi:hypothetical protein
LEAIVSKHGVSISVVRPGISAVSVAPLLSLTIEAPRNLDLFSSSEAARGQRAA